jgi:hypothetical protein
MAWRGTRLFINGECIHPPAGAGGWTRRLADRRSLLPTEVGAALANASSTELLHAWHGAGWLQIGTEQS